MDTKALFKKHVEILKAGYEKIMQELSLGSVLIDAGELIYYFEDDQSMPYRPNHQFAHWCPLDGEGHMLLIKSGQKPKLLAHIPSDFWHEPTHIEQSYWTDEFDIDIYSSREDIWKAVDALHQGAKNPLAYYGQDTKKASDMGFQVDIDKLIPRVNWLRSYKSDYELQCMSEASRLGAIAHKAAKEAFLAGGSELDIYMAYLASIRAREEELPYQAIVCLNEAGSYLHYRAKRDHIKNGHSLLIDSGANFAGYASDITRTYASPKASDHFKQLLSAMDSMQLELVDFVKPGVTMADVHYQSHIKLAEILLDQKILLNLKPEDAVKEGYTKVFYPHGVGHMLGLLVHDVAGRQVDPEGNPGEPDPRFPKLRSLRTLEDRHVITIEPGLYFIDLLLQPEKQSDRAKHYHWENIEYLTPYGGIRIEDNIQITKDARRNLTREYLPH